MPLYVADYLADTLDLQVDQTGVYMLMLMISWRRPDGALPNDMKWLQRALASCASDMHGNRFNRLVPHLLERFFVLGEDGKYRNKRLTKEREKSEKFSGKQQENVKKRYAKDNKNNDLEDTNVLPARPLQSQSHTQDKDSEAKASGGEPPTNHRKRLFDEGLPKLARMTGKGPDSVRAFVGKCLKAADDDAVIVLGLIEDAERNQAMDPSAYIAARLKGPQNGQTGSKIIQAADDLRRKIAGFDGPAGGDLGLRGGSGTPPPRLLSNR